MTLSLAEGRRVAGLTLRPIVQTHVTGHVFGSKLALFGEHAPVGVLVDDGQALQVIWLGRAYDDALAALLADDLSGR